MFSSLFHKFTSRFKAKPKPTPENKGVFTTDLALALSRARAEKSGNLNMWIMQNAIPVTLNNLHAVNAATGSAMDSAIAMDSDLKGAYTLSAGNLPQVLFSWYVQQGFIGFQACAIIAQQWLVNKACTVPAKDAIKKGYDLTVNDGSDVDVEIIANLRKLDKKFKLKKNLVNFAKFGRVFGIRIALFKVKSTDPDYYLKPFNLDGVTKGSYQGISQVDPYWITPELDGEAISDPSSENFYTPTWWRISGKRYHRSHLIITVPFEVSDILKPTYVYGGIPLPQMVYERIYAAERTANEAPQLAMTKRTNVIKTDTEIALQNPEAFEERMITFNQLRDNYGNFVIDKEEDFQQQDTALTDLDALIMTQYQLVAAIANMPATKLINTSPKGFNATGEFETDTYYDLLEGIQDSDSELLERHYDLLIRSEGLTPFGVDVTWKPLDSPEAKEISEINANNAASDLSLIQTGAIDANDIRQRIIADPNSGYNGLEDVDLKEEEEDE